MTPTPPTPTAALNTHAVAWTGIVVAVLSLASNPSVQTAVVTAFTAPTAQNIVSIVGIVAGLVLTYLGRPQTVPKD